MEQATACEFGRYATIVQIIREAERCRYKLQRTDSRLTQGEFFKTSVAGGCCMARSKSFVSYKKRKEMIDREEDRYIKAAKCNVQFDENGDFSNYEKGADSK